MTKTRRLCVFLAAWALASAPLIACPICFQVEDGPTSSGIRAAVFVLMGVTVSVLAGFARFVVRLARRSQMRAPV